jgi:hypothetical protein
MTGTVRVVIDVEQRAVYGDPASSLQAFGEFGPSFAVWREAWLFNGSAAPLVRCFYYPPSAPDRLGIPRGRGPAMVLIDDQGDQLWLSGLRCGEAGTVADAARSVLAAVFPERSESLDPVLRSLPLYDEMHVVNGDLVASRLLTQPPPAAPPGKTFVRDGRLVCRMEYDKDGTTPLDLRALWARATEPFGWLGRPTALTLYDDRAGAEGAGHEGCQLVGVGESGRELWLQLPEPDTYQRLSPGATRVVYEGAFTEYEAVKADIFRAVGMDIDPPEDRTWRDRILLRHRAQAPVISWP